MKNQKREREKEGGKEGHFLKKRTSFFPMDRLPLLVKNRPVFRNSPLLSFSLSIPLLASVQSSQPQLRRGQRNKRSVLERRGGRK